MKTGETPGAPAKANVGMREIGRQLGVSAVTVSKALAGKSGVSDAVRARIAEKAKELGYRYAPGVPACRDIGILVPGHFFGHGGSFYASLCKKLVQHLSQRGCYGVLSILTQEDEQALRLSRDPGQRPRVRAGDIRAGAARVHAHARLGGFRHPLCLHGFL